MKTDLPEPPPRSQTRLRVDTATIRFIEPEGLLSVLELEVPAEPDVRRPIYRALWSLRAQVARVESRAESRRAVHRLYLVDFDGGPLSQQRRLSIQAAIIALTEEVLGAARNDPEQRGEALVG